jgi:hypothetical protein
MASELPFLDDQRPWERADLIVNGTPPAEIDREMILVSTVGQMVAPGRTQH